MMTAEKKTQIQRFKEAARDLECDPSEAAFDAALKNVSQAPPTKDDAPQPKKPKPKR
ncbi:hypothetical protein [Roseitalea porphyridii]|uniref:hypothetical protein n=1 Tax=Roseitalea porphyridii TaxID=1852022 RepID=UPI0013158446|nr:hypothetical protein [Roseitalea porphyridii]